MFDFLEDLTRNDALDLGQAAVGIGGLLLGNREPKGMEELRGLAAQQAGLVASMNPNSPAFKAQTDIEEQDIRARNLQAIKDAMVANRRAVARTGMGLFFSPERRDEQVSRALMQGYEQSRSAARNAARGYLQSALQANQIAMGAQSALVGANAQQQQRTRGNVASGLEALFRTARTPTIGGSILNGNPRGTPLDGMSRFESFEPTFQ